MFLKSLELNGFKSFAQKTILEFPKGITAIVGPNGAGKSNVIDAIRWLLGEREAKNLRSVKAEDLIFNGTPQKSRASLAQAGLNFDNNSGFLPVEFKEVNIVRMVGRDGVSRYFLNKSEIRLKDVIDFFSRSRLGAKGLTIINQGDSDVFVKASPEERKTMIEEILGLREYQNKKIESERKLKNTFLNLEKVKAMISEVLPRLRTLKRQTNKWAKRMDVQKELEELENKYFSHKLNEINENKNSVEPALSVLKKQIGEKEKELGVLEGELKKIESPAENSAIGKIKERQNVLLTEKSNIQKEIGRLEAKLEMLTISPDSGHSLKSEELLGLIAEVKRLLGDSLTESNFDELKKAIKAVLKRIDEILSPTDDGDFKSKELKELKEVKQNLELKFESLDKELRKLEEEEMKTASNLQDFNKKFQQAFGLVEKKRGELAKIKEEENRLIFEKEKSNLKLQELKNQLEQIGKSMEQLRMTDGALKINPGELSEMEKRMFKLRTELAAIGEIDESLIKEAKEVENHYDFLTNQSEDLDKAVNDLKSLIKELSEKINHEFNSSLHLINEEFNKFFRLMFGGGQAKLKIKNYAALLPGGSLRIRNNENGDEESEAEQKEKIDEEKEVKTGIEIDLRLPKKRINSLELLSGGEKSLVSIAALLALISISPPPFLVLDEADAALDEDNSKRFAEFIKEFSKKTQFIVVTHNRATMEAADVLYGVTLSDDGTSKILSLKLEV